MTIESRSIHVSAKFFESSAFYMCAHMNWIIHVDFLFRIFNCIKLLISLRKRWDKCTQTKETNKLCEEIESKSIYDLKDVLINQNIEVQNFHTFEITQIFIQFKILCWVFITLDACRTNIKSNITTIPANLSRRNH